MVVAPDLIDELGLGQDLARMVHHRLQEGELPRGQLDGSPFDQRFPRENVDGDASVCDLRRNRLVGGSETRSDARQQFREAERLRHVVVSPRVQVGHAIGDRVLRGEDDHRHNASRLAQSNENLLSRHGRQDEIQDDQVEVGRLGQT